MIESVLQGIPGVVYLDDILASGTTEEEHLKTLEQVFDCLEKAGLCVHNDTCELMVDSVIYLGHRIAADGLYPLSEKVQARTDAPAHEMCQS